MAQKIYKQIRAGSPTLATYMGQVWQSRNVVVTFALRDLKVQYAQTYLGLMWSVMQPLTGLLIFTFFFTRVVHLNLNVPYAAFAFTGIMGWFYFTSLVGQSGTVLINNRDLIKKINFPRLVLPLSKALVGLAEFSIMLVLLAVLLAMTGTGFSGKIIFLPLAILANIITGLSVGIWLSALTIRFRDMHHVVPYLIGFGIWLTPVFYPTTMVPSGLNWLYYLHPVANVIALYRWIFLGWPVDFGQVATSLSISLILFITGLYYFVKSEKYIADYL